MDLKRIDQLRELLTRRKEIHLKAIRNGEVLQILIRRLDLTETLSWWLWWWVSLDGREFGKGLRNAQVYGLFPDGLI